MERLDFPYILNRIICVKIENSLGILEVASKLFSKDWILVYQGSNCCGKNSKLLQVCLSYAFYSNKICDIFLVSSWEYLLWCSSESVPLECFHWVPTT